MVLCKCVCIVTDAQRVSELGGLLVDDRIPIRHRVVRECTHEGRGVKAYAIDFGRLTDSAQRAIRERVPFVDEMWLRADGTEPSWCRPW